MPSLPILVLSLLFLCLASLSITSEARVRHHKWEVKYELRSPDCYKRLVVTINGITPGPTIQAQEGDTIIVDLKNGLLTENLAIHWHGIRQIGTPWFDGTEGISQCPILPGDTFRYQFVVDRPGTYLYHAHYGMQREAGLYGMIRVSPRDPEPFAYDYERSIILNDWYHKSTYEQAIGLSSNPFNWVGEPESLLIQGRGRFDCSKLTSPTLDGAVCNTSNPECSPYVQTVVPAKTYRLRVASLTSLSALSFQIEGHNMTVVEADDPSRNYWITSNVVSRNRTTPPGLGVFNYYPNHPRRSPPSTPPSPPAWDDVDIRLAQSLAIKARQGHIIKPPLTADRVIVLLNTQNTIDGYRRWSLNNVSFNLPHTPYLIALKQNMTDAFDQTPPPDGYDLLKYDIYAVANNSNATSSSGIYRLKFNTTVDVILQNANTMNKNNSETHPWHLHGHDFWVLGYGKGKFDAQNDPKKFNLVDPIMKNTVPVHSFGWTALRFRTDNPGVWAFHCHIEAHFYMGMGVVFEEGIERVGKLPSSIMGCGQTRGFHTP
ncbi:L-ascorbate oxidase [Senna tora]|uniref:L-ascorbate oxidase n=1 Tax=Senna tora TaxID=362788 RepID=A0A834X8Q5_9FABA|nr:L-ascorbate oxidase [Senna tora]